MSSADAKRPSEAVWIVTDANYSGCGETDCSCSGLLAEVFSTEQTARQYADRQGGTVSRRDVLTHLPTWMQR